MTHNEPVLLSLAHITEAEEAAVARAMRSGWIAPLGPEVDAFEAEIAERIGVHHTVALASGTAALHLGLIGLGVGPGDVVLTSTMTFAATANAIIYTGAEPFFIDSEPNTGNMDPNLLREALADLLARGEQIGAILPVDLLGKTVDYTRIEQIAAEYGIPVLADAAESLGATHAGRPAGSFGQASVFSFNGNKIMTTSGGGMLLTDDEALADRTRYLATQARQPVAHYEHTDIGYNYRLSNVLAALGRAQLGRLDSMMAQRHEWRRRYKEFVENLPGVTIFGADGDEHDNAWLTALLIDSKVAGWDASSMSTHLEDHAIESRPLWKPMHLQPVFAGARGLITGTAEQIFLRGLTLPSGSGMSANAFARVLGTIEAFVSEYQGAGR